MKKLILNSLFIGLIAFVACKKDNDDVQVTTTTSGTTTGGTTTGASTSGDLKVEFSNLVNTQSLAYNVGYKVLGGDSFTVTKLAYYISNIVLTKVDNSTYAVPNSYYIIDESNVSSKTLNLSNVPTANYKSISFMLGVDSTISSGGTGAAVGALAQSGNMYWSWNSGYIMLKFEGSSPVSTASNKVLVYHVGGYGGVNKVQRNFTFNFSTTPANVNGTIIPKIKVAAEVIELFKNPNTVNFATLSTVHAPGTNAKLIADNYADMFNLVGVEN
jgi:hypothetical protein